MSSYYMINATPGHAVFTFPSNWLTDKHDGSFIIRSHNTNTNIRKDDQFACFIDQPKTKYNSEKIVLANTGIFESVISTPTAPTEREIAINESRNKRGLPNFNYYIHDIKFQEGKPFKKYGYLDDYAYSLIKIYKRYLKPVRHFSRSITTIEKVDFDTLKKERIFFDRTLFGKLINSLPYPNRLQFLLFSIEKFGKAELRDVSVVEALPYLKEFVGSGVIKLGETLISSKKIIRTLSAQFGDEGEVGFANEDDIKSRKGINAAKIDYINPQAALFEELFSISTDFVDLFSRKDLTLSKADKDLFTKLFSKRFWPVDLNTDNQ